MRLQEHLRPGAILSVQPKEPTEQVEFARRLGEQFGRVLIFEEFNRRKNFLGVHQKLFCESGQLPWGPRGAKN